MGAGYFKISFLKFMIIMVIKIGINGFGRIGRIIFRTCLQRKDVEITAINDPAINIEYICYLIKYDSTHGRYNGDVKHVHNEIIVDGKSIKVYHEKQPCFIPWSYVGAEYVVEASGVFATLDKALGHLSGGGIKLVIVTAPSVDVPMIILGVNDHTVTPDEKVISTASSTLYCLAPVIKVLDSNFGIADGFITSIHAMTPSLKPLDSLCTRGNHWRDHRSIHQNIIPAATGACKALTKIMPQVKDKLAGIAFRVPIVDVSVLDLSIRLKTPTTLENVIKSFVKASNTYMKGIIRISCDQSVSSDFINDSHSCILDVGSCLQLKPDYYKLVCWYENEYSYACRVLDCIVQLDQKIIRNSTYTKSFNVKDNLPCKQKCPLVTSSEPFKIPLVPNAILPDGSVLISNKQLSLKKPGSDPNTDTFSRYRKQIEVTELLRIWNYNQAKKTDALRNRVAIYQHYSQYGAQKQCLNSMEKLNKAKRELDKMAHMTDNLLKKSCINLDKKSEALISSHTQTTYHYDNNNIENKNEKYAEGDSKGKDEDKALVKFSPPITDNNNLFQIKHSESVLVNRVLNEGMTEHSFFNLNIKVSPVRARTKKLLMRKANNKVAKYVLGEHNINIRDKNRAKLNFVSPENLKTPAESDELFQCNLESNYKDKLNNVKDLTSECGDFSKEQDNSNLELKFTSSLGKLIIEVDLSDIKNEITTENYCGRISTEEVIHNKETNETISHINNCTNLQETAELQVDPEMSNVKIIELPSSESLKKSDISLLPLPVVTSSRRPNDDIIFDKLDSVSGSSDSDSSFEVNKRKSQVIQITDLSNSLDDLQRLDKICKILEISDELSDDLFSALTTSKTEYFRQHKWSFKDFCEKIKLDEFCEKLFGKS